MIAYFKLRRLYIVAQKLDNMAHQLFVNAANPAQKVFRAYVAFSNLEEAPEANLIEEEEGKVAALSLLRESWLLLQKVIETMYDDEELRQRRMDSLWRIDVHVLSFELSEDANTQQMSDLLHTVAKDLRGEKIRTSIAPITPVNWQFKINGLELGALTYGILLIISLAIGRIDLLISFLFGTAIFAGAMWGIQVLANRK